MFAILKRLTGGPRKREDGQSLVEFALVVPIFLLVLFAIVDFGMAFHAWITVSNSAREGARIGAVHAPAAISSSGCGIRPPLWTRTISA
jgi:Flp pilus assembly protein TadG